MKPNLALTTDLIIQLTKEIMKECAGTSDKLEKFNLIIFGAHVVMSYVISLQGSKGLIMDLTVINRELKVDEEYCVTPLKGKVKGEAVDRDHLFPCVYVTSSGLDVIRWLKMLSSAHRMAGRKGGPGISS